MSPELPFKSFDPSQLATLEKAFKAAWAVLKPKKMVAGSSQEKAQKLALAGFIATLAKDGVTDPALVSSTSTTSASRTSSLGGDLKRFIRRSRCRNG